MKNLHGNTITNEYDHSPSLIKSKVQNHLLSNHEILPMNRAQILAARLEQERIDDDERKRLIMEENDRKIRNNVKVYRDKQREHEEKRRQEEDVRLQRLEKKKEYNNKIKEKVIQKNRKPVAEESDMGGYNNNMTFKQSVIIEDGVSAGHNYDTFSFKEGIISEEAGDYVEEEPIPERCERNPNVINIRNEIDYIIKSKLEEYKVDSGVPEHNKSYVERMNQLDMINEINKGVDNVKEFRKKGAFATTTVLDTTGDINRSKHEMSSKMDESIVNNKKTQKFVNELEKRR
jgi:hypothetical protein